MDRAEHKVGMGRRRVVRGCVTDKHSALVALVSYSSIQGSCVGPPPHMVQHAALADANKSLPPSPLHPYPPPGFTHLHLCTCLPPPPFNLPYAPVSHTCTSVSLSLLSSFLSPPPLR